MAYVFNRTLNLMGQGEPEKQDIFRTAETGAPQAGQPSTGNIKTSVEGAISTQAPSTGSGAQQAMQRSSLVAPKSDVIKQNLGKTQAPKAAGEAISGIKAAGEGLQAEADTYTAGTKSYAAPDEATITKGISGDQPSFQNISDLLQKNVTTTDQFKPTQDIAIEKAGEFTSPAGIQRTLQREGDEEYTKGMGAFDLSLLSQSPDFAQTVEAINRGQKSLYEQSDKSQKDLYDQRLKSEQDSLKAAQDATKETLTGKSQGITDTAKQAETDYDNQTLYYQGKFNPTPDQKAKWDKERDDYIASMTPEAQKGLGMYAGADYGQYINPAKANAADYVTYGSPDETDYTQFVDQDQSNQFNTIMGLLGKGDVLNKGIPMGDRFGFNQNDYINSIVSQAIDAKVQQDAVDAWKQQGGLEPGFDRERAPDYVEPPMGAPGSLAIPGYDAQVSPAGAVPVGLQTKQQDAGDFSQIGSLMVPNMPGATGGTIKSSNAKTKYNPRGL